jgi:hypothetical protein
MHELSLHSPHQSASKAPSIENPRGIDVLSYAKARAAELNAVFNALKTRSGARRVVCCFSRIVLKYKVP